MCLQQRESSSRAPWDLARMCWRTMGVLWLAVLVLLVPGCSKERGPKTAGTEPKSGAAQPAPAPAQPAAAMDENLPPILQKPWKGDLDEIVKRRVVRVLLPFRRPEFFYMEGHPAGILQEAFRELERVLNAKFKTTAANRIIVDCCTDSDRQAAGTHAGRLRRHRGVRHLNHGPENKASWTLRFRR